MVAWMLLIWLYSTSGSGVFFCHEGDSLWVKLIKRLHGEDGCFLGGSRPLQGAFWHKIMRAIEQLHESDVIDSNVMSIVVGDWPIAKF